MRKLVAGVTIIELVAVLAVVGVMFSLALPNFSAMISRSQTTTQVNDFTVALLLARSEALKAGSTFSVQAINGSDSSNEFGNGWCVVSANPGDCDPPVIRSFPAFTNNSTFNSVENNAAIVFNSYGELDGGLVQNLDICPTGDSDRRIYIALIGRSKVHRATDLAVSKRPDCT